MGRRLNSFDAELLQVQKHGMERDEIIADAIGAPEACSTLIHIAARLALMEVGLLSPEMRDKNQSGVSALFQWLADPANAADTVYSDQVGLLVQLLGEWRSHIGSLAQGAINDDLIRAMGNIAAAIDLVQGVSDYWLGLQFAEINATT
jgi:hypothetical protein